MEIDKNFHNFIGLNNPVPVKEKEVRSGSIRLKKGKAEPGAWITWKLIDYVMCTKRKRLVEI